LAFDLIDELPGAVHFSFYQGNTKPYSSIHLWICWY